MRQHQTKFVNYARERTVQEHHTNPGEVVLTEQERSADAIRSLENRDRIMEQSRNTLFGRAAALPERAPMQPLMR